MKRTVPLLLSSSLLILLNIAVLRADVVLAPLFKDHAVLQRDKPIPVWGRADAGERITVRFAGKSATTVTGQDGRWNVMLEPTPVNADGAVLVVAGKNTITVADILVGEVWLASGQSNMVFELKKTVDSAAILTTDLPLIREFRVANAVAEEPADQAVGTWKPARPTTVGAFSAVGFYFARELHQTLNVPIGIIHSSWGGTPIAAWMSAKALASDPSFAAVGERWTKTLADYPANKVKWDEEVAAWEKLKASAAEKGEKFTVEKPRDPAGPGHRYTPTGLYNGKIHPLVPYALRGVIWYQGEQDANRAGEYQKWFPAMINDWRAVFAQGDFPFYWVQLPNYNAGNPQNTGWAFMREAQSKTLSLPSTGQAIAIDQGDPDDIHPKDKREVGRRLALLALARTYGKTTIVDSGPVFAGADFQGPTVRVRFTETQGGLKTSGEPLRGFELAGSDKVFNAAEARIVGDAVTVTAANVPSPVAVRYAWRNAPVATLYNAAGLPAAPFRSDSW